MFSELVDRAIHTAGRPDCLADFAYFANETVREISKRYDFDDDLVEELASIAPGDTVINWTPSGGMRLFRREEYVEDNCQCELTRVRPQRRMRTLKKFYYRAHDYFVFSPDVCAPVKIAYYAYQPWLAYYPANQRPAVFSVETGDYGTATEEQIALVSNWILERHNNVVYQGTLAKFFASKQDPRQSVHYSAFEQGITHIIRGEASSELMGRVRG